MANDTISAPFVFHPSQEWNGNDGPWSTFMVRVGTPAQSFRVLPSTAGQETWIPVPEGCLSSDPQNCGDLRGVYPFRGSQAGFQYNASSTWKNIGLHDLILESELNYTGNGLYGFDTVRAMVDGGVELEEQVVAGIATKDFFLGVLGLGPKPSNFSDFEHPQPSFMQTLKNRNMIPSLSYAYTAGAPYRIPKTLGSLIFGGYDQSRFTTTGNAASFPFGVDDSRVLSVGIQSITATNTLAGTTTLSSSSYPVFAVIDSTVPHLWLPRSVCDRFEQAFGLKYNATNDLYFFANTTVHGDLASSKPSVVISLGNSNNPAEAVQITLPFAAFDLSASWPIVDEVTPYFPIRRAANDTQYTLGRTFLQEAYVIADYERSNFSVHQTLPPSSTQFKSDIVTIYAPGTNLSRPPSSGKLSVGVIAGIAIGAVALISLIALLGVWCRRRRKRSTKSETDEAPDNVADDLYMQSHESHAELPEQRVYEIGHPANKMGSWNAPAELDPTTQIVLLSDDAKRHEIGHPNVPTELDSSTRVMLLSDHVRRHELPGADVQRK